MTQITDWDDAYANGPHIKNADTYVPFWINQAEQYRKEMLRLNRCELDIAYGQGKREKLDIFAPKGKAKGVCIFIHGGYWLAFDKSTWSHLAKGAVQNGYYVAIPSYTLAPDAKISQITKQMIKAVSFIANLLEGDIHLAGHSAGGHLVTRMICQDIAIDAEVQSRIKHVLSISGLHDLRPLLNTQMNAQFKMDEQTAIDESAALQRPVTTAQLTCAVGAIERPEFIRQNALLANIWTGLGVNTKAIIVKNLHHFDIIAQLEDKDAPLTRLFINEGN